MSVAVSDSGVLFNSSDGVNWTRNSSIRLGNIFRINDRFVSIMGNGLWLHLNRHSVIWTGNRLIAAGQVFSTSSPYASAIYTSTDGLSWTQQDGGTSFMGLYSVAGGDGHFVAGGGGAVEYCGLRSTDGINWGSTGIDCALQHQIKTCMLTNTLTGCLLIQLR